MSLADYYHSDYFLTIIGLKANDVTKDMVKECLSFYIDDQLYNTQIYHYYYKYTNYFVTNFLETLQIGNKTIDEVNIKNTLHCFLIDPIPQVNIHQIISRPVRYK